MQIKHLIVGELETNCYLLVSENELGIIDPGGEAGEILEEIKKMEAKPKYIIATHCHPDHILGSQELRRKTGAEILIHEAEKDFLDFGVDRFLKDGDKIKIGDNTLKVLHTPGHTKGSICLWGENCIFTGDTLFERGFGRTDLPSGSQKEMEKSLEKLSKILRRGMTVCPGHGKIFKINK